MTSCDRVSRILGRRGRAGDGDPSSSGSDAPRMRETRPFGRSFGVSGRRRAALMMLPHHGAPRSLPEIPKDRHKGSLLTSIGMNPPHHFGKHGILLRLVNKNQKLNQQNLIFHAIVVPLVSYFVGNVDHIYLRNKHRFSVTLMAYVSLAIQWLSTLSIFLPFLRY